MKNPTFSRFICYNSVFSSALNNFIFAFFACIFFIYTRFLCTHTTTTDGENMAASGLLQIVEIGEHGRLLVTEGQVDKIQYI